MYTVLKEDLERLDTLLNKVQKESVGYLNRLAEEPTNKPTPQPANLMLPDSGIGLERTLHQFNTEHSDKLVASAGPRYLGFVTGGATPAAIAGDWLTSVYDQNTQSTVGPGGTSGMVEKETISMLLQLLHLPEAFDGGFVTGATMANFTCLAVARQWAGQQKGNDIAREGIRTDIKILTATPHSSAIKSLSMLGLGSNNIIEVKTAARNREAIDLEDLERKLIEFNNQPKIVISSGGTVNSVDFDDMKGLAALHKKYRFFWHIDAAFGGFAACSDLYRHLLNGWEEADSIAIDCHKWMNIPYDSAVYLVRSNHSALQLQTFQNSNAPYLGDPTKNFTYLNFGPENSRRFRALPVWFSLTAYGRRGFAWIVENNITLAKGLGERIEKETAFELAAPVRLNVVCFTTKIDRNRKEKLDAVLKQLNERGKVFMTPTLYKNIYCIRAALVNWRTTQVDIDIVINELISIETGIQ
ncbi:MAG TPA: pyridoxal-dependent decarboxylase [Flavisolibacter sp.]|nr:pyridoxal-dependent decarboxylase [Flavisolibacter sp.]